MKSSGIGGQAVMEGVMMKNGDAYAVAVRKPDKEITVKTSEYKALGKRRPVLSLPIIRGVVAFGESMVIGVKTLTYSASFFEDEEGESKKKKQQTDENKSASETKEKLAMAGTVALSVILAVAIFMILPYYLSRLLSGLISSGTVLALLEGVIRVVLFIGYVAAISQIKDIKRVFMYHGAEHKTINCIEHGYDLNVKNVKKHSRLHKRCGTSFLLVVMCVSILFFIVIRVDSAWLRVLLRLLLIPVIAGVSYEFIKLAGNSDSRIVNALSKPGLWLQGLTTREPDDGMIEVAIASVEAVYDWKPYVAEVRKEKAERKKASAEKQDKNGADAAADNADGPVTAEAILKEIEKELQRPAEKVQTRTSPRPVKKTAAKPAEKQAGKEIAATESGNIDEDAKNITSRVIEQIADSIVNDSEITYNVKSDGAQEKAKSQKAVMSDRDNIRSAEIGITSDGEEDDEILKALDKYFVTRKKDNEQ